MVGNTDILSIEKFTPAFYEKKKTEQARDKEILGMDQVARSLRARMGGICMGWVSTVIGVDGGEFYYKRRAAQRMLVLVQLCVCVKNDGKRSAPGHGSLSLSAREVEHACWLYPSEKINLMSSTV